MIFTGIGGSTFGLSMYMQSKATLFTPEQMELLDPADVNPFDRIATRFNSSSASRTSTWVLDISTSLPLLFLTSKETRKDFIKIATLWGETILINTGLTFLTKQLAQRPRPFVYNIDIDTGRKLSTNAKTAFFSGHTSMTAANTFFWAKVFTDYYPESKLKPVVWTIAATMPALTGYFRVRGGEHYPSDVLAGYAAGALIGFAVPHFHKQITNQERNFQINASLNWVSFNLFL